MMTKEGRKKNSEAMKKRWAAFKKTQTGSRIDDTSVISEIRFTGWVVRASEDKILIERC